VTRFVAIDWSGRRDRESEFIWIAEAVGSRLVHLENGLTRRDTVRWLTEGDRDVVAGLDFSFSLPAWYCEQQGWRTGPDVWRAMQDGGERLLADEIPPFWGRRTARPAPLASRERALRRTEREDVGGAKSTFQIGGAGAVGTGSIRGMALLPDLQAARFAVWPFDPAGRRTVLEIYPGALYPPTASARVVKRSWRRRRALLAEWFPDHPAALMERAAGSEDAFDAAVSALVMARHGDALTALPDLADDPVFALEGRAWTPAATGS
jgi:hypothetical protein